VNKKIESNAQVDLLWEVVTHRQARLDQDSVVWDSLDQDHKEIFQAKRLKVALF
jgi:hypothetical protein